MLRISLAASLLSVFCISSAHADKNVTMSTLITTIGSPIVNESFDSALSETASAVKGEWTVIDGVLVGKELEADKHAAVLNYQKANRNSVVRFSFKLDDQTSGFNFSLNHKGGHLFRVVVSPSKLTVNLDKDKKDPASKAVVLATEKGQFDQGKWYTMQIEMVGDKVAVQTDNGVTAQASHPTLDTDKPNYRFVMADKTLSIDDLQIWEVE